MTKSIKVHQKKRGRPATGRDPAVTIRLPQSVLDNVEAWSKSQEVEPARSQAIRRLVELGLTVQASKRPSKPGRTSRARELASEAIDKMGDPTADPGERAQRHRRLTKGPEEFREVRVDRAKK